MATAKARNSAHFSPLERLGPGLITGVADDDPSGIATYSQAGAQFGFGLLWTMPLAYPLMSSVQMLCARLGRITGEGLAANIKRRFPRPVLLTAVVLLLIANTLNIAADLAAMGEATALIVPVPRQAATLAFGLLSLGLQVAIPYSHYVRFLKWLTLSLLAYVAVLLFVHVPWGDVLRASVWPAMPLGRDAAMVIVAVFGTTISPYLFFWQASEEIEEMHEKHEDSLKKDRHDAVPELDRIAFDTWTGMGFSQIVAFAIMVATALTLHAKGTVDIQSAADAASALKPVAGSIASTWRAAGVLAGVAVAMLFASSPVTLHVFHRDPA